MTPAGRRSRRSSWTVRRCSCRSSTRSSARWRRPIVCASSRRRCRRVRACRSPRCRSSPRRSTRRPGRGLVVLLPEDADARDLAEAAAWFLGPERVAYLPSRGVRWESGLRRRSPRRRACARARRARGGRARLRVGGRGRRADTAGRASPEPLRIAVGDSPGVEGSRRSSRWRATSASSASRTAGSSRCAAASSTCSRRRAASRSASSSSATRSSRCERSPRSRSALHPVDDSLVYPAAARRGRGAQLVGGRRGAAGPRRSRPRVRRRSRPRLGAGRGAPRLARGVRPRRLRPRRRDGARPRSRRRSPRSRRRSRRSRRAGSRRPRRSCRASSPAETASSSRSRIMRRCAQQNAAPRRRACSRRASRSRGPSSSSPSRPRARLRLARPRPGLLPDAQVFRKRAPRAARTHGPRAQSFADLRTGDYVVHEDHGVGKLLGFETKTVASVTRDYLFLAFRGDDRLYVRTSRSARSRATSAPTRPPCAVEARRQGVGPPQGAHAGVARARGRPHPPLRRARASDRRRVLAERDMLESGSRRSFRTARPRTGSARSRR